MRLRSSIGPTMTVLILLSSCSGSGATGGRDQAGTDNKLADHSRAGDTIGIQDGQSDVLQRPNDWAEESHSSKSDADYEKVFAQTEVKSITLTIDSKDWQDIWDDMTDIYGEFGSGGSQIPEVPEEALDACEDLSDGDSCEFLKGTTPVSGTCTTVWDGGLVACVVEGSGPGDDPMVAACLNHVSGDECSANMGPETISGICLGPDVLRCVPLEAIAACEGKDDGETCSIETPMGSLSGTCRLMETTVACVIQMGPPVPRNPADGDPAVPGAEVAGGPNLEFGRNPIWIPATVEFDGVTWTKVGFRFKGNSTLMHTWSSGSMKLPFKLDFDQFEDEYPEIYNQRFWGFQKLSFGNNMRDSSYLRDKVAGDLFAAAGVCTPKRAFVRVYIDFGEGPINLGIYTLAEIPDKPLVKRCFGKSGGNLYKGESGAASWQQGLVVDETSFSKESNDDSSDWSDVIGAIAALHGDRTQSEQWRETFGKAFDIQVFLRWLAVNTVIQDWDQYGVAPHNYYIYGNPNESGKFYWIPWDHNESLKSAGGMMGPPPLDMSTVTDRWPLIRFLIDDTTCSALYWSFVDEFVKGPFEAETVKAMMKKEHDLIAPYMEDPNEVAEVDEDAVSAEAFMASIDTLYKHVDSRHEAMDSARTTR